METQTCEYWRILEESENNQAIYLCLTQWEYARENKKKRRVACIPGIFLPREYKMKVREIIKQVHTDVIHGAVQQFPKCCVSIASLMRTMVKWIHGMMSYPKFKVFLTTVFLEPFPIGFVMKGKFDERTLCVSAQTHRVSVDSYYIKYTWKTVNPSTHIVQGGLRVGLSFLDCWQLRTRRCLCLFFSEPSDDT